MVPIVPKYVFPADCIHDDRVIGRCTSSEELSVSCIVTRSFRVGREFSCFLDTAKNVMSQYKYQFISEMTREPV